MSGRRRENRGDNASVVTDRTAQVQAVRADQSMILTIRELTFWTLGQCRFSANVLVGAASAR